MQLACALCTFQSPGIGNCHAEGYTGIGRPSVINRTLALHEGDQHRRWLTGLQQNNRLSQMLRAHTHTLSL